MKNIAQLLDKYACVYRLDDQIAGQLNVSPVKNGLPITIYGSFAKDNLAQCELYSVQVDGYSEDIVAEEADEERVYRLIEEILKGDYLYILKQENIRDRLSGGSVYLSVGTLIRDFYCHDQRKLKKLLAQGELESRPYDVRL